jgi:hypothetical protein
MLTDFTPSAFVRSYWPGWTLPHCDTDGDAVILERIGRVRSLSCLSLQESVPVVGSGPRQLRSARV